MSYKKKRRELEPVANVLRSVYPAPDQLHTARVFSWWNRTVPEKIVKHARPVRLRDGLLTVHVSSSVWANELHFLSEDLLKRIRAYAPESGVKRIRFQVGPLPDFPVRHKPEPLPAEPVRLAALPEELGRALARVDDDELRSTIAQAATAGLLRDREER